jgi:hypothetical protein
VTVAVDVVPGSTAGIDQATAKAGEAARAGQTARQTAAAGGGAGGGSSVAPETYARVSAGLGQIQQAAQGGVGGMVGLAGSISRMVPVAGLAVAAGGLLVGGIAAVNNSFRTLGPTLAEASASLQGFQAVLREGRQTGLTTAEAFRTAFAQRPEAVRGLIEAQGRGDEGAQRTILRREQARARAEQQQAESFQPEQVGAEFGQFIRQQRGLYRAGGGNRSQYQAALRRYAGVFGGRGSAAVRIDELWARAGNRPEDMPEGLRNIDLSTLDETTIQQLTSQFSARAVGARAQVQAAGGLLREGGMVSLRAGAPERPDTGFRAQTGDILTLSDVMQQEAVRTQQEQARFDQLMQNLNEWRAEMLRVLGRPVVW